MLELKHKNSILLIHDMSDPNYISIQKVNLYYDIDWIGREDILLAQSVNPRMKIVADNWRINVSPLGFIPLKRSNLITIHTDNVDIESTYGFKTAIAYTLLCLNQSFFLINSKSILYFSNLIYNKCIHNKVAFDNGESIEFNITNRLDYHENSKCAIRI